MPKLKKYKAKVYDQKQIHTLLDAAKDTDMYGIILQKSLVCKEWQKGMKEYRFNYNIKYVEQLRSAILENQKFSLEKEHTDKETKGIYPAWHRICAIMDRLEDTVGYVNALVLGKCRNQRSAFDFYEYINCVFVIIDCIKTMGSIFGLNTEKIEAIENSNDVFGPERSADGCDKRFF